MTNSTALFQNLSLDLTDHRMDSKLISPLIKILPFPSTTSPSSLVATDPHSTHQPAVSQTFPHPSLCSRSTLHLCTKPAGKLCISHTHVKGGARMRTLAHWFNFKSPYEIVQETRVRSLGWKDPWRRERLPTLVVFWPGEFHGLYSPWGHKELGQDWATFTLLYETAAIWLK